jgi:hypothetical protein
LPRVALRERGLRDDSNDADCNVKGEATMPELTYRGTTVDAETLAPFRSRRILGTPLRDEKRHAAQRSAPRLTESCRTPN